MFAAKVSTPQRVGYPFHLHHDNLKLVHQKNCYESNNQSLLKDCKIILGIVLDFQKMSIDILDVFKEPKNDLHFLRFFVN